MDNHGHREHSAHRSKPKPPTSADHKPAETHDTKPPAANLPKPSGDHALKPAVSNDAKPAAGNPAKPAAADAKPPAAAGAQPAADASAAPQADDLDGRDDMVHSGTSIGMGFNTIKNGQVLQPVFPVKDVEFQENPINDRTFTVQFIESAIGLNQAVDGTLKVAPNVSQIIPNLQAGAEISAHHSLKYNLVDTYCVITINNVVFERKMNGSYSMGDNPKAYAGKAQSIYSNFGDEVIVGESHGYSISIIMQLEGKQREESTKTDSSITLKHPTAGEVSASLSTLFSNFNSRNIVNIKSHSRGLPDDILTSRNIDSIKDSEKFITTLLDMLRSISHLSPTTGNGADGKRASGSGNNVAATDSRSSNPGSSTVTSVTTPRKKATYAVIDYIRIPINSVPIPPTEVATNDQFNKYFMDIQTIKEFLNCALMCYERTISYRKLIELANDNSYCLDLSQTKYAQQLLQADGELKRLQQQILEMVHAIQANPFERSYMQYVKNLNEVIQRLNLSPEIPGNPLKIDVIKFNEGLIFAKHVTLSRKEHAKHVLRGHVKDFVILPGVKSLCISSSLDDKSRDEAKIRIGYHHIIGVKQITHYAPVTSQLSLVPYQEGHKDKDKFQIKELKFKLKLAKTTEAKDSIPIMVYQKLPVNFPPIPMIPSATHRDTAELPVTAHVSHPADTSSSGSSSSSSGSSASSNLEAAAAASVPRPTYSVLADRLQNIAVQQAPLPVRHHEHTSPRFNLLDRRSGDRSVVNEPAELLSPTDASAKKEKERVEKAAHDAPASSSTSKP